MEKVKIVQMLTAPNDSAYQGALLGLGSDGVIYRAANDSKWHVYFPCAFADEAEVPNAGGKPQSVAKSD